MGVTINNKSTTTELPPKNGQQQKPLGGLNAFYWYQIFALVSAVVEAQKNVQAGMQLAKKGLNMHVKLSSGERESIMSVRVG